MLLEGPPGGVGRPPLTASRHRLRLGRLQVGPLVSYVSAGAWLVGLLCHVGLFWMYTGRDLLRFLLHILHFFLLFLTCVSA